MGVFCSLPASKVIFKPSAKSMDVSGFISAPPKVLTSYVTVSVPTSVLALVNVTTCPSIDSSLPVWGVSGFSGVVPPASFLPLSVKMYDLLASVSGVLPSKLMNVP